MVCVITLIDLSGKKTVLLCTEISFPSGVEQKTQNFPCFLQIWIKPCVLLSSLLASTAAVFPWQSWNLMRQSSLVSDHSAAQFYVGRWCLEGGKWAGCNCFFQSSQGPCRHLAGASFLLLHARHKEPETHWGRNWFLETGVLITAEISLLLLSYSKSSVNALML